VDPRSWTRDEIEAYVAGSGVRVYSTALQDVDVPDWILTAAERPGSFDAAGAVAQAHPDDVGEVVSLALECSDVSGSAVETRARFLIDGEWRVVHVRIVNLIDQHRVGGLLVCDRIEGLATSTSVSEPSPFAGEHDRAAWMVIRTDSLGVVLDAEGKVEEITGRTRDEVIGRRPIEFMHPDSMRDIAPLWMTLLEEGPGATRSSRRCFVHPDGTHLWAEWTYINRLDADGGGDVLSLAYDITERRAQEEALRRSNLEIRRLAEESRMLAEDFRMLADEVPSAVFRCEDDGRVTFRNTRWAEMFRSWAPDDPVQAVVHPDDRPLLAELFATLLSEGGGEPRSIEVRALDDDQVLGVRCRAVAGHDDAPRRIVGSVTDITTTVQLRRAARHDRLTGLLNRAAIEEKLAAAVTDHVEKTIVVFVDLDGFKEVNDVHGHDAGDAVLQVVAQRLEAIVRPGDAVARYGGDEFVMVCRARHESAGTITERLEQALDGKIEVPGGWWQPCASIGAVCPVPGEEPASVLRRADLAMFGVKRARTAWRRRFER
jgi:diguanylate cyclase (GGDEF)-like protein/PAS domain S-box-containing protein